MKPLNILPFVVVPLLLALTGTAAYLTVTHNWNFEITSYAVFLFTFLYVIIFERIIPLKAEWKVRKIEVRADIKHLIFSVAIFDALGKAAALSLILHIHRYLFQVHEVWESLPFLLSFIIAKIIGEFLPYVYHRISHIGKESSFTSLFLWKIHSIHHLPTSLNWLKTNWVHPINMFLNTLLKVLPLLFLGFNEEIIFLVGVTHGVIAYVSHANIRSVTGILDYLIVTPRIHHFHHSKLLHEAKNFGNILPFWDIVLGTYYNRKGEVDKVGVVEASYQYPEQNKYFRQMAFPFVRKNCCS